MLLDDIQFFAGKDRSQMELLELFDTMHAEGKQLAFSCTEYPEDVRGLEPRLAARVASGLVCGIAPLEFEVRLEILQRHSRSVGTDVDDGTLRLIAERTTTSAWCLQGTLESLIARSRIQDRSLSCGFARVVVDELLGTEADPEEGQAH